MNKIKKTKKNAKSSTCDDSKSSAKFYAEHMKKWAAIHGKNERDIEKQSKWDKSWDKAKNTKPDSHYKFDWLKDSKNCCSKPSKYKNIISNNLKFWSCSNCGADLGDIT